MGISPAEHNGLLKLSPSRAKDYIQCPKLFYYKTVLNIKTPPTQATLRGTLAHHAFEHIFDHPAESRTLDQALLYIIPAYNALTNPFVPRDSVALGSPEYTIRLKEQAFDDIFVEGSEDYLKKEISSKEYKNLFADSHELNIFLDSVYTSVTGWFAMENPKIFEPTFREKYFFYTIDSIPLHGFVDRIDLISDKDNLQKVYISDYKTGKPPSERFQDEAFFQLEIYALLYQAETGITPDFLRLIYVSQGTKESILTRRVTPDLLAKTRQKIESVWKGINNSYKNDNWPAKKQVLCDWCYFKEHCPAFVEGIENLLPEEIEYRLNKGVISN